MREQAKLEEIYSLASASIGLPVALDSPAIEAFRLQLQRYEELNERRKWLDTRAQELLADNADFNRLIRMPGIAAITALTILAEAGDLRRFRHHRQFLKYCRLDLAKSQSGQSSGKETLSKRGNKRLRMIFGLAGLRAIHLRENEFRAKYQRYMNANPLDQDRNRKALTAIRPKWLALYMRSSSTERTISRSRITDFPVDRSLSHGPLRHLDLVDNARTFHWAPTLF